jgi:hypothetical protein
MTAALDRRIARHEFQLADIADIDNARAAATLIVRRFGTGDADPEVICADQIAAGV